MVQHELIVLNIRFRKSKKKLWTFMYPNGEKAKLDYILGRKKWRNSFKNCQLTTLLILSAPITGSFPVKSTSAIDKANLLQIVHRTKSTGELCYVTTTYKTDMLLMSMTATKLYQKKL